MHSTRNQSSGSSKRSKKPEKKEERHEKQTIELLKTGILVKVTEYLKLEEINEFCLISKSMQIKILSAPTVKIRILEEKVQNAQKKLQTVFHSPEQLDDHINWLEALQTRLYLNNIERMKSETYHYLEKLRHHQNPNILNCIVQPQQAKVYLSNIKQKNSKTRELESDVNLLKSLGAKDALKIVYPHSAPQPKVIPTKGEDISTEIMAFLGSGDSHINTGLSGNFIVDERCKDSADNKLFNEDRWKGWDDVRSQHRYEKYRQLASEKVKTSEQLSNTISYIKKISNYFYIKPNA